MLTVEAQQLAAQILHDLDAFAERPPVASWPDSLWPEVGAGERREDESRSDAGARRVQA